MFLQLLTCSEIHKQIWKENEYTRNFSYIKNMLFGIVLWNYCGICICIYARCLPSFAAHLRIGRLPKNFQPPQLRLQNMFRSIWPSPPVKIYYQDTSFSFGKTKKTSSFPCAYTGQYLTQRLVCPDLIPLFSFNAIFYNFPFTCINGWILWYNSAPTLHPWDLPALPPIEVNSHLGKENKQESNCRGHQVPNKQGTHWLQCFLAGST